MPSDTVFVNIAFPIPIVIANTASGPSLLYFPKAIGPGYIPAFFKKFIYIFNITNNKSCHYNYIILN